MDPTLPKKKGKIKQTNADVFIKAHQIGSCADQLVNCPYPCVSSPPCRHFEVPDLEADQMRRFLFISCPDGLGLVLGWLLVSDGVWPTAKICYNQRHSRRYVNRSAFEELFETHTPNDFIFPHPLKPLRTTFVIFLKKGWFKGGKRKSPCSMNCYNEKRWHRHL